jgi:LPS-assembly protein
MGGKGVLGGTIGGFIASALLLLNAVAQPTNPSPPGAPAPGAQPPATSPGTSAQPPANGSAASKPDQPVLVTADELQYQQDLGLVIAKGHVELSQNNQILLADTITYNQRNDTVTASGNVSITQPTGDIAFADYMELRNNFRDGFIKDVRMLLFDGSRLAGNAARRVGGVRTEVRRAVYSPCQLCASDPTAPPVWQIKAEDAVDDKDLLIVEYHDAIMEIEGIPVMWSPYFSHPDPSVKRASGFLPPVFGHDSSNGERFGIPYYWVIAPDKDATFRPVFTTDGGTVLSGQYRQRFGNGFLTTDDSVTFGSKSTNPRTTDVNASGVRGHLSGVGLWDLTANWRAGFEGTATTDQTYLQRYHFPYTTNFLTDHAYLERFGPTSYANISAYGYQNLNSNFSIAAEPFVLPQAYYNLTTQPDVLGGRWQFNGDVLNLAKRDTYNVRRLSFGGQWRRPFAGPLGDRYQFSINMRGDGYDTDFSPGSGFATTPETKVTGRTFPQAALNWRYPWINQIGNINALIEPVAAAFAAPIGGNPARIPNEDAQSFEFDDTDLFIGNRWPGYDRVDGGQRVDYGLHAGVFNPVAGSTQILIGESYRLQSDTQFPVGTGLDHRRSDVVGRVTVSPSGYFNLFYRARLDSQDLAMRRQEVGAYGGVANLNGSISYIATSSIPSQPTVLPASQISFGVNFALTDRWSGQITQTQNLNQGATALNSAVHLTYRDDCLAVTGTISRSAISVGDVKPGVSFVVSFVFRNLGDVSLSP